MVFAIVSSTNRVEDFEKNGASQLKFQLRQRVVNHIFKAQY